jgi:hypothetical protein
LLTVARPACRDGKSQFMLAFQTMNPTAGFRAMGADAVFKALNPSNTGSISQPDFVNGMTQLMRQLRSAGTAVT